jgi:predicted nucleotidyltransferase
MSMEILRGIAARHPYPLLFAAVSGAHLYGFPSPDSDWDLRGVHVLPPRELVGLTRGPDTVSMAGDTDGLDLDLVTHDAEKAFRLVMKPDGSILEQIHSPLVVVTSPEHEELRAIARRAVTRHHVHHYLGFAANQWRLLAKETPPRVKPLLYTYRVLLTGLHLMRTGEIDANLLSLNAEARLPFVPELIARKHAGGEDGTLSPAEVESHRAEVERLMAALEEAGRMTHLPHEASVGAALHDLLLRLRLR